VTSTQTSKEHTAVTDTPLAAAADALLQRKGYTLDLWLADRLDDGMSTSQIAKALADECEGIVAPSREAIRRWTKQIRNDAA
jgi:hypothetical protein